MANLPPGYKLPVLDRFTEARIRRLPIPPNKISLILLIASGMDVAQITEWSKEDGVFVSWWTCEAKKDLTDEVREARDLDCVKLAERTGMNACARVSAVFSTS